MKNTITLLVGALCLMITSQSMATSNSFFEAGMSIGKSKLSGDGVDLKADSKSFLLKAGKQLDLNWYLVGEFSGSKSDDTQLILGRKAFVDSRDSRYTARVGYYYPLVQDFGFTFETGLLHSRIKDRFSREFAATLTSPLQHKETSTKGIVQAGIRAQTEAYDLEVNYSIAGDYRILHIGGPIKINDKLGLNVFYDYARDKSGQTPGKSGMFGIAMRKYF